MAREFQVVAEATRLLMPIQGVAIAAAAEAKAYAGMVVGVSRIAFADRVWKSSLRATSMRLGGL
jgi:hypothetical protein